MEQVQMGTSDLRVSRIGLGCNNFGRRIDLEQTRAATRSVRSRSSERSIAAAT